MYLMRRNILKSLTLAYGQMILKSGFFHADPHPGNILICKGSEVSPYPAINIFFLKSQFLSNLVSTYMRVNFLNKIFFFQKKVALLDYGQVKDLPEKLRLGYANLVLALADNDPVRASESYRCYPISTVSFSI